MLGWLVVAASLTRGADIPLTASTGPITSSVRIRPGTYTLGDVTGHGAIQIASDGVTVDFQGATLQSPDTENGRMEAFNGVGLDIAGRKHVTIRNAHIHGFQFNVRLLRSSDIRLENCELSQSRSQRISDGGNVFNKWLDVRGLESWRNYGAGAWIEKCSKCDVSGMSVGQSQNGLVFVNSNDNRVFGCDFSYNSGWGIALYGSSGNLICWNHADFVNRPWGGGWGGDSSGVVLTAGSNNNTWAHNSFTHGGDGFFLAAKTGGFDGSGKLRVAGNCNQNQVAYNDGSWSTANAFESTFSSRNMFFHNVANDSNYGFWLGYSDKNLIEGNQIKRSRIDGIAHEQGAKNVYLGNDIEDTLGVAIHLWGGRDSKYLQAPSTNNAILNNKVRGAKRAIDLTNSQSYFAFGNVMRDAPPPPDFKQEPATMKVLEGATISTDFESHFTLERKAEVESLKPVGFLLYRDSDQPKGWSWLAATSYGMRDYRNMALPWMMKDAKTLRLWGPKPKTPWRLVLPDWMTETRGSDPREILVTARPNTRPYGEFRDFRIQAMVGYKPPQWINGRLLDLSWHVRWYKWFRNDHDAYRDTAGWSRLFNGPCLKEEYLPDLPEIPSYTAPEPGLPSHHFALVGTTNVKLEAGAYNFDTISDDGIQIFVDGNLVIDNWTHHGATEDHAVVNLVTGVHKLEVHYCQEDGAAALRVGFHRVSAR